MNKATVIQELHRIGVIQYGQFILKNGAASPIYIDLRRMVSYPILLRIMTELFWEQVAQLKWDLVCGVPYTALPLATALSLTYEKPMVLRRKEAKSYGTKKMIEGVYQAGQSCLVLEDVVTTGSSIMETIQDLESEKLQVKYVIAVLDREAGGAQNLAERGYTFTSLFTLSELLA